ncbi:hypothetical protein OG568_06620 [Streptomyces sp. NBC_01450]|nr:hypothetical protein [Streptomyces sp. NBC_01450]
MDDIADVVLADLYQHRDVFDGLALGGHQHHDRPAEFHRVLRTPADPLQLPALLHTDRPDEHTGSTSHVHFQEQMLGGSLLPPNDQEVDYLDKAT